MGFEPREGFGKRKFPTAAARRICGGISDEGAPKGAEAPWGERSDGFANPLSPPIKKQTLVSVFLIVV